MTTPALHASALLDTARERYDLSPQLRERADAAWRGGFRSGGQWMGVAISLLRGSPVAAANAPFHRYGVVKYSLATAASLVVLVLAWICGSVLLTPLAVLTFYTIEAQMVFLFPLLLDNVPNPLRASRRFSVRAGGTLRVMATVLRLAMTMLFGGFAGGGFVRSWCVGCLAVCIWYERVRLNAAGGVQPVFEIGASGPLSIRYEHIEGWALDAPVRLLYVSDLHLGWKWSRIEGQVLRTARRCRPDVILLGGDLVDRSSAIDRLGRLVRRLTTLSPVYAILGNHDHRTGAAAIRDVLEKAGAVWLREGMSIGTLSIGPAIEPATGAKRILCTHDPAIFAEASQAGIDLVLAGHLHGGQCVLWNHRGKQYPGAWINRWTGLRFQKGASTLIVSRGAADTLPLRWRCPREVILCEIS